MTGYTMKKISIILLLLIFTGSFLWVKKISAQGAGISWGEPVNLSNSVTSSTYPTIVSDPFGHVHVFWGEDYKGQPVNLENPVEISTTIMYSQWDGKSWSSPIDLFFTLAGTYNFPSAALDSSNVLHLVWQSYDGIYYSSVPVQDAGDVKAWNKAQNIAHFRGSGPFIYASSNGLLHIVFSAWENAETGESDRNIYYMNSNDGGNFWPTPIKISAIPEDSNTFASYPEILADPQGRLHISWYQAEPPNYIGTSILYSKSLDNGISWSYPKELGHISTNEKWATSPELAMLPSGELHIIWVCGEGSGRCHRFSKDGGDTWSDTSREFSDMISLAGHDTLVIDGDGILYWILQLRYPEAIYYSFWNGNEWSPLQVVNDGALAQGHYLRASIRCGNQIGLVLVDQVQKEIWYIPGTTSAKYITPLPIVTPQSTVTV
jgi:hypothetical protein